MVCARFLSGVSFLKISSHLYLLKYSTILQKFNLKACLHVKGKLTLNEGSLICTLYSTLNNSNNMSINNKVK